jgi:5-methylthioadenosine/S-adenosylhomocysteine deaminase
MQPLYDPVRSLVYAAGEPRSARSSSAAGKIVRDGKVLTFDYRDASARLQMPQRRAIQKVPGLD